MTTNFRLFQSTLAAEANIRTLDAQTQEQVTMFDTALRNWSVVKNEVTAANSDLAEVLQSAHETLTENFGNDWLSKPTFVVVTKAPFGNIIELLEFTEMRDKDSEQKTNFLIQSFQKNGFPATITDINFLVDFSNVLDQQIGVMPLTLVYSSYNQCAMPIVGCASNQQQQPTPQQSFLSSLLPF